MALQRYRLGSEKRRSRSRWRTRIYFLFPAFLLALALFGVWQFYPKFSGDSEPTSDLVKSEVSKPVPVLEEPKAEAMEPGVKEPSEIELSAVRENTKSSETPEASRPITPSAVKKAPPAVSSKKSTPVPAAPPAAVPVEELAVKTEPAPPVLVASMALSMNIIGRRKEPDGSFTEVLVNEGSVLRSRDNFQVHVEVSRPAYVYILIYDSHGRAGQLFPDPKIDHPEFIEAGKKIVIPRQDLWF